MNTPSTTEVALREALNDLHTSVTYAAPTKLFNDVECYEARVPVEFIQQVEAALALPKPPAQVIRPKENTALWDKAAERINEILSLPDSADFYKYIGAAYIEKGCDKLHELVWGGTMG